MKKLFLLILLLSAKSLIANDSIPVTKMTHKFGGRIDVMIFGDTYAGVESRNGLQYIAPARSASNGEHDDMSRQNRLRMSAAPTRFNYTMTATNILNGTAKGFIEVDFMGNSDANLNLIRMRHAYIDLKWKRSSVLFGQTSHLTMPDEVVANTVTYGGGYPLYPLNRPAQVQYRYNFGKFSNITAAAAMFSGTTGTHQSYALMPDVQVRFTGGNSSRHSYGVIIGAKSIKPRIATDVGLRTEEQLMTFNAGLFARYILKGYSLKAFGLWGEDLSSLSILGGYAPLFVDLHERDFRYAAIAGVSAFVDFDSPVSKKGWQYGIFGGLQQNLGSRDHVLTAQATIPNANLVGFWRVAPRVYLHADKHFSLGLEYMISGSKWADGFDTKYKPLNTELTHSSRLTFLARYKF